MDEYNKKPLWQWITIYLIVGAVVYGLVYYFVLGKKDGYNYSPATVTPTRTISETTAQKNTVTLTADGFKPASLTIKSGTKVTWTNKNGEMANVSSDPHPTHTNYPALNLGTFKDGGTLSLTFDKAGTYGYHNHLNAAQTGTIVVE